MLSGRFHTFLNLSPARTHHNMQHIMRKFSNPVLKLNMAESIQLYYWRAHANY